MDLLGATAGASSSRSSSHSPSDTFSPLPPTPPNPFLIPDPTANAYMGFMDDEFNVTKVDPLAPPPSAAPFDFFPFLAPSSVSSSSPDSGIGSSSSPSSTDSPRGIDPQLVGTPAQSKAMSDFDEEEEDHQDDQHLEEEEDQDEPETPSADDDSIAPVKVGGRGVSGRKGTVQSGGIVKKTGSMMKKENQPTGMLSTTSVEPDDWRPTPEEYKKMSSKEKRQLRNKISARNFRVRRKEYITTLETDIAERDRLIDHIRTELLGTKSENSALRQEIHALKKALLDGRGLPNTPVLPPPAPLPVVSAAALASAPKPPSPAPKSPILAPNTQKDLPTSPRLSSRNFWGGMAGGLPGFGGITSVHTTLVPEWGSVLSGKGGAPNAERRSPTLQENINPILNGVTATSLAGMGQGTKNPKDPSLPLNNFDSFADRNMFTLKSMEDFRMQLWTRMGQQQAQNRQHLPQDPNHPSGISGLAAGIRPHYFSKQSPTLSTLLSGKSASSSYPTPPPSPPMANSQPRQPTPSEQQALLASIASQTLVRKLGGAFWDAFSGSSSSPTAHGLPRKDWDSEKVRKVLEGKAVVRVVDVDPTPSPSMPPPPVASSSKAPVAPKYEKALSSLNKPCISLLEEGIKSLSLKRESSV